MQREASGRLGMGGRSSALVPAGACWPFCCYGPGGGGRRGKSSDNGARRRPNKARRAWAVGLDRSARPAANRASTAPLQRPANGGAWARRTMGQMGNATARPSSRPLSARDCLRPSWDATPWPAFVLSNSVAQHCVALRRGGAAAAAPACIGSALRRPRARGACGLGCLYDCDASKRRGTSGRAWRGYVDSRLVYWSPAPPVVVSEPTALGGAPLPELPVWSVCLPACCCCCCCSSCETLLQAGKKASGRTSIWLVRLTCNWC